MDINSLVESIPADISNFIDDIIIGNEELDCGYVLKYSGSEIKVSKLNNYEEFKSRLSNYDASIIDKINNEGKYIINNELVIKISDKDKYKVVYIIKCDTNVEEKKDDSDKLTLLIADDSPVITKFFTKTFEDKYNILVAKDGDEAIKYVEDYKDKIKGAFIDLQMPGKNGYDVLDYFKEHDLFKVIPVSVISGEDTQDGIEKAMGYGIVDMLQKPFDAPSAESIVNKTINQ